MSAVTVTLTPGEVKSVNTGGTASITVGTNVFVKNLSSYRVQLKESASQPTDMTANATALAPFGQDGHEREFVAGSLEIWAMCPTASPDAILLAVETA